MAAAMASARISGGARPDRAAAAYDAAMDLSPKNLGRGGGIVATIIGAGVTIVGFAMRSSSGEGGVDRFGNAAGGIVELAVLLLGIVLVLVGVLAIRAAPKAGKEVMTREAALAELATHAVPFWVCARCHAFMERNFGTGCTECGSTVDCLEVANEADRKTATAAMS